LGSQNTQNKVEHLTISLVKPEFLESGQVLKSQTASPDFEIDVGGHPGLLYVERKQGMKPSWARLFNQSINTAKLGTISTVSAAFLLKVSGRYFVLTFGNGRHLIRADVCEERFGLIVVLNSVDRESIRVIDKQSLDALQSHSRIQSGYGTTADQFGVDVEQDMLKAIVGTPKTESLGTRMAGADSLSVSVRTDLDNLPALLEQYKAKFETELDADYAWVNNIRQVKSSAAIVDALDSTLITRLQSSDHSRVWLSIPEIIDWSLVVGFTFTGGGKNRYPDINLAGFLATVEPTDITIDLLHRRDVMGANAENEPIGRRWSVYKCLYAEIDHDGAKYVLNGGTWFQVSEDFVLATNTKFDAATYSPLKLPPYKGGDEGPYNKAIADADPGTFALLDAKVIPHGGGQGKVEVCDLLSVNKHLIHIKRYVRSSVLSHLFAQGFVSGQLIQIDSTFREKVKAKLSEPYATLISVESRPAQHEFTIVFAIISNAPGTKLDLPFFSRVNFNNTSKILEGFGYRVHLLKVDWDEESAKKVTGPPAKTKKLA
jgi:uncharacterized protein (TIGR04141 family)